MRRATSPFLALVAATVAGGVAPARGAPDGGPPAEAVAHHPAAAARKAALAPAGRTTTIVVEDDIGHPLERQADFLMAAPSYRRAIASDRDLQWAEAVGLYQQALIELAAAAQLKPPQQMEAAAFKLDLERRRSRALAEDAAGQPASAVPRPGGGPPTPPRLPPVERARLLRQKMMAVRATTGSTPDALRSATLAALAAAPPAPEVRLLMCATLGVSGDRAAARQQLAGVSAAERSDPARALMLATCQAALGYRDDALASLAVAVNRLGPSSKFLPGPSREIQSANDWDPLRPDPRFLRLFR